MKRSNNNSTIQQFNSTIHILSEQTLAYELIETAEALTRFCDENQTIEWLAYDTEFISEKRFNPQLCLIQVATEKGVFIIDSIAIEDVRPFITLLVNPDILKITHAGDNDYRIFYGLYGVTPVNVFDTQIASGFLSFRYPISFKDLMYQKLKLKVDKGFKVSNWSSRPMHKSQLQYAAQDVYYLYELYKILRNELEELNRFGWVMEDCTKLEDPDFYYSAPYKELGKSKTFTNLNMKEKVFFLRLIQWRIGLAQELNQSKNMVLDTKIMYEVIRSMSSGKAALKSHRIIPNWLISRHWEAFSKLYQDPHTEEERAIVKEYSNPIRTNLQRSLTIDLLTAVLKYKAMEHNIASTIIVSRADLNRMKQLPDYFPAYLENGWRKQILGLAFIQWLKERKQLTIDMQDDKCVIRMK